MTGPGCAVTCNFINLLLLLPHPRRLIVDVLPRCLSAGVDLKLVPERGRDILLRVLNVTGDEFVSPCIYHRGSQRPIEMMNYITTFGATLHSKNVSNPADWKVKNKTPDF